MTKKDEMRMAGIILGGCVGSAGGPAGTFLGAITGCLLMDMAARGKNSV